MEWNDGVPIRLIGTTQDITDRVAAETERALLASAVEQTSDSIWMQDLNNDVTYVNRTRRTGQAARQRRHQARRPPRACAGG